MNQQLRKQQSALGVFFVPFIIIGMSLFILLIGFSDVQPKQYSFRINQVSEETIQAPVTIEDTEQTETNRQRARESVADVFVFQPAISNQQVELVNDYYALIKSIRENEYTYEAIYSMYEAGNLSEYIDISQVEINRNANQTVPFGQLDESERLIVYYSELLTKEDDSLIELDRSLSNESINYLLSLNNANLNTMQNQTIDLLTSVLSNEIESVDLNDIISNLDAYINTLDLSDESKNIIREMMQELIVPTVVFSESETEKRRVDAENAVQPSYILQGQIIAQEGHIIDQATYRKLDLFGYLDRSSNNDLLIIFIILILIHAILLYYILYQENGGTLTHTAIGTYSVAYAILFTLSFLVIKILHLLQVNGIDYAMILMPVYVLPMLLIPRTNLKLTFFFMIFFNLFALFISHDGDSMTVTFITSMVYLFSTLISLSYHMMVDRITSLRAAFLYALICHMIFLVPIVLMINVNILSEPSVNILSFVLFNLLISFGTYFFIEPYWHKLLSSKAPLTLNQLANLNHPLLKIIVEKAPGTYHHSMMVANIAANAAESIHADSLLVRVASYYHDIGKTLHPLFFVENLSEGMESPHSMITAAESAAIIISHVTEGERLLREYDMPESIINICKQHHGTTLVKYFYHQAKQEDSQVTAELFSYPGPKPQTKEAMIIMIADSVEAASRTIKQHTQAAFENLVQNIINGKLQEGQFEECQMTVAELEIVKKSIVQTVAGMYHTRIEYPD